MSEQRANVCLKSARKAFAWERIMLILVMIVVSIGFLLFGICYLSR